MGSAKNVISSIIAWIIAIIVVIFVIYFFFIYKSPAIRDHEYDPDVEFHNQLP